MPHERRNIYKIAREARGLTQEAAAEKLGISDSSIRAYETGQRVPPSEVVELMTILYDASYLPYQHLREVNSMYSRVVPEVVPCGVREATVKFLNRIYQFVDNHADRRLMWITEDDMVDPTERAEYDGIQEELDGIVAAATALRCAKEGHSNGP